MTLYQTTTKIRIKQSADKYEDISIEEGTNVFFDEETGMLAFGDNPPVEAPKFAQAIRIGWAKRLEDDSDDLTTK